MASWYVPRSVVEGLGFRVQGTHHRVVNTRSPLEFRIAFTTPVFGLSGPEKPLTSKGFGSLNNPLILTCNPAVHYVKSVP